MDQNTAERTNAEECYRQLLAREGDFIGSAIEDGYWNAVSFELFHMGQIEDSNDNIERARNHFEKSLEAAKKGIIDEWIAYVEGTIHYLNNNRTGLEQVIDRAEPNR